MGEHQVYVVTARRRRGHGVRCQQFSGRRRGGSENGRTNAADGRGFLADRSFGRPFVCLHVSSSSSCAAAASTFRPRPPALAQVKHMRRTPPPQSSYYVLSLSSAPGDQTSFLALTERESSSSVQQMFI